LTKFECPFEHTIGSSPSHVAMKGDLVSGDEVAFQLKLVEDLDMLATRLNLLGERSLTSKVVTHHIP